MCNPGAVLRGHLDYGSMSYDLGNVGHLCVVFAILWRSSTVSEYYWQAYMVAPLAVEGGK